MKILIKESSEDYGKKVKKGVVYGNCFVIDFVKRSNGLSTRDIVCGANLSERTFRRMKNGTNAVNVEHFLKLVKFLNKKGIAVNLLDVIVSPKQVDSVSNLEKELVRQWEEHILKIEKTKAKERRLNRQLNEAREQLADVKYANKNLHSELKDSLELIGKFRGMGLLKRLRFALFRKF